MEIFKKDFEATLPLLKQAIEECDFVAFDTEMTGLASPANVPKPFDSLPTRFTKVSSSASSFLVIQLGICTFTWNESLSAYEARPFNFPCFPTTTPPSNGPNFPNSNYGGIEDISKATGGERFFKCQSSSLEFLMKNDFDFNKWIRHGIPFLTRQEEEAYIQRATEKEAMAQQQQASGGGNNAHNIPVDNRNRNFFESTISAIKEWLENSTEKYLTVPAGNSFFRRLVYQIARTEFPDQLHVTSNAQARSMHVCRMTDEIRLEQQRSKVPKPPALNLRRVLDMISDAKKPLIGHNCFLDLMQTSQQFLWELPLELEDWKRALTLEWNTIIDTKHLAGHSLISPLLEATALEVVAESVQKEPFSSVGPKVFMASGFDRYKTSELVETQESSDTRKAIDVKDRSAPTTPGATAPKEKVPDAQFHEAGYDAYMTGLSFLRFAGYILKQHERRMAEGEGEGEEEHVRKRQRLEDSADVTGNEVALESTETSNGDYKKPETSVGREDAEVEEGELDETPMERDALIERRKRVIMNNPTKEILEWNGLTSYYNLLHMMRSDIPVMNLKGPEEVPEDRPWSFLLKNIPSGFQTSTLFYLFAPYKPVRFNWVDDSTAWIHIPRQDVSMTVLDSTTPKNITEKTPSDIETVTADPELTALSPGLLGAKRVSPMCIGGEELAMKGREAGVVPEAANIEVVAWKTWYDDREVQERQARETQRQQQQRDAVQRPIKRIGRAFALGASTGQGLSAVSSPSADQDQEQQQQPLQQPEAGSGLAATVGNNSPLAVAGTKRKLEDSSSEHDIEGR